MGILSTLAVSSDMWRSSSYSDMDSLFGGGSYGSTVSGIQGAAIWTIVSLILAVIGGILIYFLFVKKSVKPANKFLAWMKNFLRFDTMTIEDIAKIAYLCLAIFITLSSFGLIAVNFLSFLLTLILGNLILRVAFELTMITIMIWRNTTDLKKEICKEKTKAEMKAEKVVEKK